MGRKQVLEHGSAGQELLALMAQSSPSRRQSRRRFATVSISPCTGVRMSGLAQPRASRLVQREHGQFQPQFGRPTPFSPRGA